MARAVWPGAVSFGLVAVPVKAYVASRDHNISFRQLEEATGSRIRYQKVSAASGEVVAPERSGRGYEIRSGHYVTNSDDDLAVVQPESTRRIG